MYSFLPEHIPCPASPDDDQWRKKVYDLSEVAAKKAIEFVQETEDGSTKKRGGITSSWLHYKLEKRKNDLLDLKSVVKPEECYIWIGDEDGGGKRAKKAKIK
mmetsp:Transcript_10830/g.20902  ORF Transcript_10830/g.20902 Transcript_10830/m.20902 type:complete len:102 (+) Transcript_10830:892-1197(+)